MHDEGMNATPIYTSVVAETGIDFDATVKRCSSLATFTFSSPARPARTTTPRVGAKPITNKRKKRS